jgi:hypothetical protein
MKLWIDDKRPAPKDFSLVARNAKQAMEFLHTCPVTFISFDHDLGDGLDGIAVAKYIEACAESGGLPEIEWKVHSANPVGRANIKAAMESAERFWKKRDAENHYEYEQPVKRFMRYRNDGNAKHQLCAVSQAVRTMHFLYGWFYREHKDQALDLYVEAQLLRRAFGIDGCDNADLATSVYAGTHDEILPKGVDDRSKKE